MIGAYQKSVQAQLAEAIEGVADMRRDLDAIAESTVGVPDDEHDAEGSTIGFERARVSALLAAGERRVVDLEGALERIGTGSYQTCERCGDEIGVERLEALPSTRVCISCSSQFGSN